MNQAHATSNADDQDAEISARIEIYRSAQRFVEKLKTNKEELTKNLSLARQELGRAGQSVISAKQKKKAAVSVGEMQAAARELDKAQSEHDSATQLIENLERALSANPGELQSASRDVVRARQEIFAAKSEALLEQLKGSEEFASVRLALEKVYACRIRTGGAPEFGRFLAALFSDTLDQRPAWEWTDQLATAIGAELGLD